MRHEALDIVLSWLLISIHAPIVGCDAVNNEKDGFDSVISIHAPIVGCDLAIWD